jgi:hypothetical protein
MYYSSHLHCLNLFPPIRRQKIISPFLHFLSYIVWKLHNHVSIYVIIYEKCVRVCVCVYERECVCVCV